MIRLDEQILRAYLRMEEAQRQRLWMERTWHPEHFDWVKRGGPPPMTETKCIRMEELDRLGFGESHYQRMLEMENQAKSELEALVEEHHLWVHFERIPGFGKYLAGAFIAAGGDIQRAPRVSSFWKGMGLDVLPDGTVPRRIRGAKNVERKLPALPHVTRVGEQIRQQLLRTKGLGKEIYDKEKARYREKYPDKAKMFAHKHGLRIAQKLLYACLWEKWREAYGLPAPWPYAFDILNHDDTGRITIEDFYKRPV